ncbi:hypothetical protein ALC57_19060, partial [Trachymyrmex cornetzi]
KQATEDADADIVNTSIEIAKNNQTVVIVGQDIDLLVLLHQLNPKNYDIYFQKSGPGNVKDLFYTSNCFKHKSVKNVVAFLHGFSGCDTISAFAGKGKKTTVKALLSTKNLSTLANVFYQKDA